MLFPDRINVAFAFCLFASLSMPALPVTLTYSYPAHSDVANPGEIALLSVIAGSVSGTEEVTLERTAQEYQFWGRGGSTVEVYDAASGIHLFKGKIGSSPGNLRTSLPPATENFPKPTYRVRIIQRTPWDINSDGVVNVQDGIRLLQAVAGVKPLTTDREETGDLDGDGKVTVNDVTVLLRQIIGQAG